MPAPGISLFNFKEVLHTAVFPLVPLRLKPCPVIAWAINSSSKLIYYLIHILGEHHIEKHYIGVHGAGGVFCDVQIS